MALSAEGLPDKTLLIVDDDAPFRQRLARAMEARGFLVTAAETAEEAFRSPAKRRPHSRSSTCASDNPATAST